MDFIAITLSFVLGGIFSVVAWTFFIVWKRINVSEWWINLLKKKAQISTQSDLDLQARNAQLMSRLDAYDERLAKIEAKIAPLYEEFC